MKRRTRIFLAFLGLVVLGAAVWLFAIPSPRSLRTHDPALTSLMRQRVDEARRAGDTLAIRQVWVPLDDISPKIRRAVIVAEDWRFRDHHGVDWSALADEVHWTGDDHFTWWSASDLRALLGALRYGWSHRNELKGRSTITQQLAKNLYFGTKRSLLRKAVELVVAGRLERSLGKDRILELYLNVAELGPGIFGVEAASRAYFGVSAARVTDEEAAALAATLPQPLTSNPAHAPARMLWRQAMILERLNPAPGVPPGPLPEPDPALVLADPGAVLSDPTVRPLEPGRMSPDSTAIASDEQVFRPDSAAFPLDSTAFPADSVTFPPDSAVFTPDSAARASDAAPRPDSVPPPGPGDSFDSTTSGTR